MLTLTASVCIDASPQQTWDVLADLPRISAWVPAIRHASCPHRARGVGAVRVCELDSFNVEETITAWVEGESLTYEGVGAPMMKRARNTWTVRIENGQTQVTSVSQVELKGGLFGRLLEPMMGLVARRMARANLATLKYLVEHGEPAPAGLQLPTPVAC